MVKNHKLSSIFYAHHILCLSAIFAMQIFIHFLSSMKAMRYILPWHFFRFRTFKSRERQDYRNFKKQRFYSDIAMVNNLESHPFLAPPKTYIDPEKCNQNTRAYHFQTLWKMLGVCTEMAMARLGIDFRSFLNPPCLVEHDLFYNSARAFKNTMANFSINSCIFSLTILGTLYSLLYPSRVML